MIKSEQDIQLNLPMRSHQIIILKETERADYLSVRIFSASWNLNQIQTAAIEYFRQRFTEKAKITKTILRLKPQTKVSQKGVVVKPINK